MSFENSVLEGFESILEAPGLDFGGIGKEFFEIFTHFGCFFQVVLPSIPPIIFNAKSPFRLLAANMAFLRTFWAHLGLPFALRAQF